MLNQARAEYVLGNKICEKKKEYICIFFLTNYYGARVENFARSWCLFDMQKTCRNFQRHEVKFRAREFIINSRNVHVMA